MPKLDQLEIICPDGNIFFHDLNSEKGITNIGQHPDNDIVIDSPSIGPFQAVLDHQRKPFRIMVLSKESNARIAGKIVEPNVFQELRDWQSVDLDGFTLTLLENMDVPTRTGAESGTVPARLTITEEKPALPAVVPAPTVPAGKETPAPSAMEVAQPPSLPAVPASLISMRPPDERDDYIVVELANRERAIDVEQVASYELVIANGGPIVASFDVMVDGINPEWLTIYPQRVNLNEGAQGTILISIIPPRLTTSTAGEHHMAFCVTSANYPGHVTRLGATMVVAPYYEFAIGNLSPSNQSASWRKNASATSLPVINQGNDASSYQIMAQDAENGCRFEFPMNDQVSLVKQVEVKVPPGKALEVPIKITPLKRSLVRLRAQQYHYSVTTQSLNESTAIRTVAGTFTSRPLFGPIHVLIGLILAAIAVFFLFQPRIFSLAATPEVVTLGAPVTLSWNVSPFTSNLQFKNMPDAIKPAQNQLSVTPATTLSTYTLVARNWLSTLLSLPDVTMTTSPILAIPIMPAITTFTVDKTDVIQGQPITIKWSIQNATSAVLTVEDVPTALTPEQLNGENTLILNNNSLIVLEATNASGTIYQSQYVRVWSPSDLKVDFTVDPAQVTAGDPVTVTWDVAGAGFTVDTVTVAPFNEPLPAKYSLQYFPTESMYFVLKVNVRDYTLSVPKYVTVLPADAQPTINYFKANPPALTAAGTVEFSWSVSGPTDSITISDKSGVLKDKLPVEGFADLPVSATGTYVLTAAKGKQSAAAVVDIQVNALKDVTVAITSVVPQTGISRGDNVYVYFSVKPKVVVTDGPEVSGTVVITDGFDSCEVKLPITSCEFVFHRSGSNKQLTATYSGDAVYRRTTSAPYPSNSYIQVFGSTVNITNINVVYVAPVVPTALQGLDSSGTQDATTTATGPSVGQVGYLVFDFAPTAASATTPVQGNFDVMIQDLDVTTAAQTPMCLNLALVLAKDADGNNVGRGICKFVFTGIGNKAFVVKYKGNEIYDGFDSDYTNPDQAALKIAVSQATTQIKLTAQAPAGSAQVGQPVTLTLQVSVAAQGGGVVPGIGTVTVKDNTSTLCSMAIDKNGLAVCTFTPGQTIANLIINYTGDKVNYKDSSGTGTITYAITKALADVSITAFQFTPANPTNQNPTVGQTIAVQIRAFSDITKNDLKEGKVNVNLTDRVNTTPLTICSFNLATDTVPLTCNVLVKHGGASAITLSFTPTDNFTAGTLDSRTFSTNAASVTVQTLSVDRQQAVEGETVTITFGVKPVLTTALVPAGGFTVVTSIASETCGETLPDKNTCALTFAGNPTDNHRTLSVHFGDGVDYQPVTGTINNYVVLHKATISISGTSSSPQVFGNLTVNFQIAPTYFDSITRGAVLPTGTINITANQNGSGYTSCNAAMATYASTGSCELSGLRAGANTLVAVFTPDNGSYASSTSTPPYPIDVSKVNMPMRLVAQSSSTSYIGSPVTFTLGAALAGTAPTGTAIITAQNSSGDQEVCQSPIQLSSGQGSCSITFTTADTWDLYYTYSGDKNYNEVTTLQPLSVQHISIRYPTVTTITGWTPKNNNLIQINFTVSKFLVNGATLPDGISGTVTVLIEGASAQCTGFVDYDPITGIASGSCQIYPPGLTTFNAVASYAGDDNFDGSDSSPYAITPN